MPASTPRADSTPRPRLLTTIIKIKSAVDPGVRYTIVVNPSGSITCSCPAGWHRRPCWHVRAVAS